MFSLSIQDILIKYDNLPSKYSYRIMKYDDLYSENIFTKCITCMAKQENSAKKFNLVCLVVGIYPLNTHFSPEAWFTLGLLSR